MSTPQRNDSNDVAFASECELIVYLKPEWGIAKYIGTRAQLEADPDHVIPPGTKWPEGFDDLYWESGKLHFWLRRQRPEGAKGPRRAFLEVDWWCLRIEPVNLSWRKHDIMVKARELKALIYRNSPEGIRAFNLEMKRFCQARADERFQGFLARIVGKRL